MTRPDNAVPTRRHARRALAAGVSAAVAVGGLVLVTGGPGAAAADAPLAQSVGRFLDGQVGGMPLQSLADLKDARATNPGTPSAQNPLSATLLGQLEVPLGNALKLPGGGALTLGAVNQVAVAKSDGYSYGASGAVSNSGGISAGGAEGAFPANATIKLSANALTGLLGGSLPTLPIPTLPGLPALPDASALGSVDATIGAVSGLAQTKSGGDAVRPQYQIGSLGLTISSPALGSLLSELVGGGTGLTSTITTILNALPTLPIGTVLPAACTDTITGGTLPNAIYIPAHGKDKGAITIDPANAEISIDLAKILDESGLTLNELPANTDLLGYVLGQLPSLLTSGLSGLVTDLTGTLVDAGAACIAAINSDPVLKILGTLLSDLQSAQSTFTDQLDAIGAMLTSASSDPISMLTDALSQAIAIGVNVESGPGKGPDNTTHKYTSVLDATPDQATDVVAEQTLVRAVEVDLGSDAGATLALGNAAAGPSTPAATTPTPTVTPTPTPTTTVPGTAVPTGVPAGLANTDTGTPVLPLVLLLLGLVMAGAGAVTWRLRTGLGGKHGA